jgi:hypothetical protein
MELVSIIFGDIVEGIEVVTFAKGVVSEGEIFAEGVVVAAGVVVVEGIIVDEVVKFVEGVILDEGAVFAEGAIFVEGAIAEVVIFVEGIVVVDCNLCEGCERELRSAFSSGVVNVKYRIIHVIDISKTTANIENIRSIYI